MRRVGVILCSKSKQDYACNVREMYDGSISFKARRIFMDMAYDEWYVMSGNHGFMEPSMEIEPYENSFIKKLRVAPSRVVSQDEITRWRNIIDSQFNDKDFELHCHISHPHYVEFSKIFPNTKYIKPQLNMTTTAWQYHDATEMLMTGSTLEECLDFIQKPFKIKRPKETKKWFYHPTHGEFYGNAWDLSKTYNIDNGSCYGLSMGVDAIAYGWVLNKELLPLVYQTPKGYYRLPREVSKEIRDSYPYKKRTGLRQALEQLEQIYG